VRVLVVDDSLIIREGLSRLLAGAGHDVRAIADPRDVDAAVDHDRPDMVVLDLRMPPTFTDEGLRTAMALRSRQPDLGILVLSQYVVAEYAVRLLEGGPRRTGYLLKDRIMDPVQLCAALERLGEGGTVVDPDVCTALLVARRRDDPLDRLTGREVEVLRSMAEGLSDRGIAERLHLSPNTVATHVRHIFGKLDLPELRAANRRVLAVLALLQKD
jgi:DNA-binding NarL/FixJ family response regulator